MLTHWLRIDWDGLDLPPMQPREPGILAAVDEWHHRHYHLCPRWLFRPICSRRARRLWADLD